MGTKPIWGVGAILVLWACGSYSAAVPPDPDNAALLYYQALLLRPTPDDTTSSEMDEVLRGADTDPIVRAYLSASQEAIQIAVKATGISQCTWGTMSAPWGTMPSGLMNLTGQLRQLVRLLEVDARTLAVDGEHRMALERCLGTRRLARHTADQTATWYPLSLQFHTSAFDGIQFTLGRMPSGNSTLTWLQGQLGAVQGPPPLPGSATQIALEEALQFLNQQPQWIQTWRTNVAAQMADETTKAELLGLSDDDLLERARQSYDSFLASANRLMGGDVPYDQKRAGLLQLTDGLSAQATGSDPVSLLLSWMPNVTELYDAHMLRMAHFNALRAAIEVYLAKAGTGQLPDALPAGLPTDPYSGQAFLYEKTQDGFLLRCQAKDIAEDKVHEYAFKVRP